MVARGRAVRVAWVRGDWTTAQLRLWGPLLTERAGKPRRGWRERIEPGVYRAHGVGCRSSEDRRAGRRCGCPFEIKVPGSRPGSTRTVTLTGSVSEVRAERRRLMAAGRTAPVDPLAEAQTLDEFAGHFFRAKEHVLAPNTIAGYETDYRLRISPALGRSLLGELTRERIEVWRADLARTATSRRMIVSAVACLRTMLSEAVRWGRLADNPALRLDLPAEETHEEQPAERVLDERQLAALYESCRGPGDAPLPARVETMARAAAEAGLRRGELVALRWEDVDLEACRITVRRSAWQASGERGEKSTKGRRARVVHISPTFARRLADHYAESVIESGADAAGYVWSGSTGGRMSTHSASQAIRRALERAGLVDADGKALVTLHGLRHTCGSILLARGVPLIVVSRHLGHRDPQVTARVYAHLIDDAQLAEAARVFEDSALLERSADSRGAENGA